ncbi:MAG: glycosyltransferase family 2 protein, partial [Legionella sp.]|nr:glycosyltransferase family 2 protein [Legionella sp.]
DADTILEKDAISFVLYDFLSSEHCLAVGGSLYLLNGNQVKNGKLLTKRMPQKLVPAMQSIEYLRSFSYGRVGLNQMSGALCYPGAFTLFETEALREFGGFDTNNFSFDAEVILKFHHKMRQLHYPTSVRFSVNAHAWTLAPDTLGAYWIQRNHWQRGMLLSAFKHITMFLNPKYGFIGLVTFPCYLLFEIAGPCVEFIAYCLLILSLIFHIVPLSLIAWYVFLAWGGLILLTLGVFYLNIITSHRFYRFSDLIRSLGLTTFEWFGFRQFKAACCFFGTLHFFWTQLKSCLFKIRRMPQSPSE